MSCDQFVGIIVNKNYYFSKDGLTICKNIHKVKGTQGNLKIEDKWFKRVATNVRTPCSSLAISDTILKRFKDSILQGGKNFTVNNQLSPRFPYSDLCRLVGHHWLTFEVTETIVKISSRSENNFTNIYSVLYLIDLQTNGKLKEEIIDCKAKSFDKICIIVNVGLDILGNTFAVFFNWDSLHARLNSRYEAWSYKKRKHKKVKAYRKSV